MAKIIAISGPTGVGKTKIAVALAEEINAEIISFDSRQIYKELNIGVARPSQEELHRVKHHLIAHKSIHDSYSAQDFANDANAILSDSHHYILVGGTGFYLRALEFGLDELPDISKETRAKITNEYETFGLLHLQNRLKEIDEESYYTIDIENPRRIQRIIELWEEHKLVYSEIIGTLDTKKREIQHIVLDIPREELYHRINIRVDDMVENGLLDEAKALFPNRNLNALNTVGYKELFDYFDSTMPLDTAIDKIKQHTRNYAKRQITWNRKYLKDAHWINPTENGALQMIQKIMNF